ncbi:MAG: diadenylate cyclase CdaA [Clostridia bacterium]|nr:diadenylate cyclase CdaA [Clostridia bacterium]
MKDFLSVIQLAKVKDVIDILIVAYLFYNTFKLLRNTAAARLFKGIVLLLAIMLVATHMELYALGSIMSGLMQVGAFAIVVVFQPELRRILEQFGKMSLNIFGSRNANEEATQLMIMQTVEAVSDMAWSKTGALIVFETGDSMANIAATGTKVNADMTAELIKNVFYPKAPLHDGAVVVSNNRLHSAGCILPLSAKFDISKDLGTRHRAALGVSEAHDCCVVVVSEETGAISFAKGGILKRHLAPETLERLLQQELMPSVNNVDSKSITNWLKGVLNK